MFCWILDFLSDKIRWNMKYRTSISLVNLTSVKDNNRIMIIYIYSSVRLRRHFIKCFLILAVHWYCGIWWESFGATFDSVCTQLWYKKHIWTKKGNISQKDHYDPFIMTHLYGINTKISSHLLKQMTMIMDMGEMFNFP